VINAASKADFRKVSMQMFWGKLASVGQEVDIVFARRFPLPTGFLLFLQVFV
jgi:hypothetical protein